MYMFMHHEGSTVHIQGMNTVRLTENYYYRQTRHTTKDNKR